MTIADPRRNKPTPALHQAKDSDMQPFHTDTHDPADVELDDEVRRTLLAGAGDAEELDLSRRVAAHALEDVIAGEVRRSRSPRRLRRLPALAAVGGLAAAVLVAGALAPGSDRTGGGSRTASAPFAPASASATEVLEQAAKRMLASEGDVVGTGTVWHSIAHDERGAAESWFDGDRGTARWAMFSPGDSGTALGGDRLASWPATYYVLDVAADGTTTIRQYERPAGSATWRAQPGGSQMNESSDENGMKFGLPSIEGEALAWLRAVDAAVAPSDLRAANLRFVERTHMMFSPPTNDGTFGESSDAARALQMLYLLRIARLEGAAVAQLYRDVIDIGTLERLDDGAVDGRPVVRLRLFDPPAGPGGAELASVLLLDASSGQPIGMEAVDGSSRELFEAPRRTKEVGTDAASCGRESMPPCELLRGEGPIAETANRTAAAMAAPLDPTPGPNGGGEVVGGGPSSTGSRATADAAPATTAM